MLPKEIKDRIELNRQKVLDLKEQLKEDTKAAFNEGCDYLFKHYPSLKSFSWVQYTPHFNDGDTCYFSAQYDYSLTINEEEEEWIKDYERSDERSEPLFENQEAYSKLALAVQENNPPIPPEITPNYYKMEEERISRNWANPKTIVPWEESWRYKRYLDDLKTFEKLRSAPKEKVEKLAVTKSLLDVIHDFLRNFEDDDLESMFGDHAKVIITKDRKYTEEYYHD